MEAFIAPPEKIPFYLKIGIWISRKITGRDLLPARLLAWYPKIAVGSGILEALIAHRDASLTQRLLKLVRLQASFAAACPFCIDMNSQEYAKYGISADELSALQGKAEVEKTPTFSQREKIAVKYARLISESPLSFSQSFIDILKENFTEREIVILAGTAAQVNYWARFLQALGVPPAGFTSNCRI